MLTTTFRINGRVQGVGFRYTTAMTAQMLGLTGTVKNEADGAVTIVLQASESDREEFLDTLKSEAKRGFAIIDTIERVDESDEETLSSFRIIH
ncbi:acylphosphatase [Aerococcus vaginalis]